MAIYQGKFIVEGRHYEWLPAEFRRSPEFGVRKQTFPTLDLKNITIVQQAPATTDTYIEKRKVHRQAWQVSWDESAPMDLSMRDHLETLYNLQKEVWIQFDDEQTRDGAILETIGTDYSSYFTPTYPIMPYGNDPSDPREYNGTVFVNNIPRYTGFSIDSEIGMVRFDTPLTVNDVVQMAYSWKVKVRVDQCDIGAGFRLARHMYVGNVMFVQAAPTYLTDPFPVTMPWDKTIHATTLDERLGICIASGASGSSGSSFNSHTTVLWKDTRYTL
jgi:hypothetical protein